MELFSLGHRRTRHAGELAVQPEVVLERDRGQGHLLALNPQALLGFDGLVETLAPASAGHLASREFVHDDDLAILDDVVTVPLEERVSLQGRLEVARQRGIRVVHVLDPEELLHLGDAFLGRRHGLLFEVDEVVAALFCALIARDEARHEAGEQEVLIGGLFGLAADDERRPGFVDEDVVDLVHNREVTLLLDPLIQFHDHVVAEVVETELVVRAVRDVGGVRLRPRARAEVDEPLVGCGVARFEDVRRVVGDDADRHAQETVDGPHPLGVAAGQIVVDGHDVDTAAGQGVEYGGERRDEGLALAGPHLSHAALVQHDATEHLDVEVAHAERPLHCLSAGREYLGQDGVHRLLEAFVLALMSRLDQLSTTLQVRVMPLVLGRLFRLAGLLDFVANPVDKSPNLLVGAGQHLGFQLVDPVREGLDPPELPVI